MDDFRVLPAARVRELGRMFAGTGWAFGSDPPERVAARLGWPVRASHGTALVVDAGLGVGDGTALLGVEEGRVVSLFVDVSDDGDRDGDQLARVRRCHDAFASAAAALTEEFGAPASSEPGPSPRLNWRAGGVTVWLWNSWRSVSISAEPGGDADLRACPVPALGPDEPGEPGEPDAAVPFTIPLWQGNPEGPLTWDGLPGVLAEVALRLPDLAVVVVDAGNGRYAQLRQDLDAVVAEITAATLGDAGTGAATALRDLGWTPHHGPGWSNWRIVVPWLAPAADHERVAAAVVARLRALPGLDGPPGLRYRAWIDGSLRPLELAGLGVPRTGY